MGQLGFGRSFFSLAVAVVVATSIVQVGSGVASAQPSVDPSTVCSLEGDQATLVDEQQIRDACASGGGPAARAGTPDGYKLWRPGFVRDGNYRYQSNAYPFKQVRIDPEGVTTLASIEVLYNIRLGGGSSKMWVLSASVNFLENDANLTSQFSVEYHCGVNLPRSSDPSCNEYAGDGADPDTDLRIYNPDDELQYYFGYSNSVTKFPMLKFTVAWSTGITQEYKFRGWDVCVRARTTAFCAGTGGEIDTPL